MNSNNPNADPLNYDDILFMVYFTLDDPIYSFLMLFSMEVLTFPNEDVVMIVTNYTNPLFIHHISTL